MLGSGAGGVEAGHLDSFSVSQGRFVDGYGFLVLFLRVVGSFSGPEGTVILEDV